MRKILWLPVLTAVCAFTSLRADLTVVQRVDGMGRNMDVTAMFKGGHVRFDVSPGVTLLMDLKSGELTKLIRAQKSYIKIPSDGMTPKDGALALAPDGKKDTIAGYPADEFTCNIGGKRATVMLTKAAPDYANLTKEISAFYGMDVATLPGFPLRIVEEAQPGETVTSTVLSISAEPIADSDFEIPADYKPATIPSPTPPAPDASKPAVNP